MSEEDKKLILEEMREDSEKDKKHSFGVWYPISDPPECDMYGIVLCLNGKRGDVRYVHAVHQDNCNCYKEGKFWPGGTVDPDLTVAWLKLPACPIDITASKLDSRNRYEEKL